MIGPAEVQNLIGCWWYNYDEGNFDELKKLLSDDAHFTCRTDSGTTEYEEFVRADIHGRDNVMAWQIDHRSNSGYPLRHNGTNIHIVGNDDETVFNSYIFVTNITDGRPFNISSGRFCGVIRREGNDLRLAKLEVVLDTMSSIAFKEAR